LGAGFQAGEGLFAEAGEPVPAVGVCERDAVCHFVNVCLGVVLGSVRSEVKRNGGKEVPHHLQ